MMTTGTLSYAVPALRVVNDILTAAAAMTAFSFILFSLQFLKRRQKLAWAFLPLLFCITLIYSADALESTAVSARTQLIWQKLHWTGFIFLPFVFFNFSSVLLSLTGKSLRGTGRAAILISGAAAAGFTVMLWKNRLFGGSWQIPGIGSTMVYGVRTDWFWVFFAVLMAFSFLMLTIAFTRTRTHASRRRMFYLILSSIGIFIGTFPLLVFGSGKVLTKHLLVFWALSVLANAAVEAMLLLLGYSVTILSAPWSDRQARLHMFEWLMRGPGTAIVTLGVVTLVNRGTGLLGLNIAGLSSLMTVVTVICLEYLVSFLLPRMERSSLVGYGKEDYDVYNQISEMMVFRPELLSFLEAVLGALCDRFQCREGFAAVWDESGKIDPLVRIGENNSALPDLEDLPRQFQNGKDEILSVENGILIPIVEVNEAGRMFLGVIGLFDPEFSQELLQEEKDVLEEAVERVRTVLWRRRYLMTASRVLKKGNEDLENDPFLKGNVLDRQTILPDDDAVRTENVTAWVKDALTHYWGGPRLSENPLLEFRVVRGELETGEENPINALRAVLRRALEKIRPEGPRSFTGEWTLYNIIDLKYLEKMKVKDAARKLSMSEADFYRKQKVALETLAKTILKMENDQDAESAHESGEESE